MSIDPTEERKKLITRELEAYKQSESQPTYTLDFRGNRQNLKVISVSPDKLLLSHKNSRVFAQLDEHPKKSLVLQEPDSAESQKIILRLLRETDKYGALKSELKELGQQSPGVITQEGMLVNGNTRAAALIDIGYPAIEVAVLPANADSDDLLDIEMSLQMTQLTHQDYSFTNRLLMMRRYLDAGHTPKQLAYKMAWIKRGEHKVFQHMRLLDFIEDVRNLSKAHIPYSIFDKKQEHLKNLDDDYRALVNEGDLVYANHLKWTRLSAIILGINKDQVRAMDEDFTDKELARRIENKVELKDFVKSFENKPTVDDGLEDILGGGRVDAPKINMRNLLGHVINDENFDVSTGNLDADLPEIVAKLSEQLRIGADYIIDKKKTKDTVEAPIEALVAAKMRLIDIQDQLFDTADLPSFKNERFEFQLMEVKKAVDELMKKYDELKMIK